MKLGTNDIGSVYLGTNAVQKVYLGTNEVWTSFTGLLDDYPNAEAAYSLRLLRSAYTGDAIGVRIDTTGQPEYNIGFVDGELDVVTLEGYCTGGLNAYVKTWYDQSGNAINATQSTDANQPQIVSSGSVILENGKPCVNWTTNSFMINASFNPSSSVGFSAFNVYSTPVDAASNSTTLGLYAFGQTSDSNFFGGKGFSTGLLSGEYMTFTRNTNVSAGRLGSSTYRRGANVQVLESEFYLSSGFTFYQNNSAQTMNLTVNGATTTANWSPSIYTLTGGMYLNAFVNSLSSQNCKMQEIIFYDNSQSSNRTGIETNINSFYSIY